MNRPSTLRIWNEILSVNSHCQVNTGLEDEMKIHNLLMVTFLFLCHCTEFHSCEKTSPLWNFNHDVESGTYYTFSVYTPLEEKRQGSTINVKEILTMRDDSTFSWYKTDSLGDTLAVYKGHYSVRQTTERNWNGDAKVYSLVFHTDTVMKKWEFAENGEIKRLKDFKKQEASFSTPDSILLDVSPKDSCFTLGYELRDDMCHDGYFYESGRRYCGNAAFRDSSVGKYYY